VDLDKRLTANIKHLLAKIRKLEKGEIK